MYMIFYDRGYRAQDNAEHMCRWVMKNHPEIKTGYILNSSSYDWDRLAAEGFNLIDGLDRINTHKELHACDYACSSIFNEGINLSFKGCHCKRIFLNHGCFLAPINYIKAERDNIDLFIAANRAEYDTMLNPFHGLTKDQVALCGQPRQDDLVKLQKKPHKEDAILVQFWQRPAKWAKDNDKEFLRSAFFEKTCGLLSNDKLIAFCRKNRLKLIFKMHSIQYDWLRHYKRYENDVVKLSDLSEPFEPVFIRSKLMVTDISSNAYEMAKIGKPCIYFEPDPKELFDWRKERNGEHEFDLLHHSIGPVINSSVAAAVDEIIKTVENNYRLSPVYTKRRYSQIAFVNDEHNCERCFDAILSVKRSRTAENKGEKAQAAAAEPKDSNAYGHDGCYLYF